MPAVQGCNLVLDSLVPRRLVCGPPTSQRAVCTNVPSSPVLSTVYVSCAKKIELRIATTLL